MGEGSAAPRVFVVDDEPDLVELYSMTLGEDYEVRAAHGGPEALDLIEEEEGFDVALIDRRMPDVPGDEVLDRLHEIAPECRVAMVTAVEPDFDIVEMPFDEYLVKPITRAGVQETVDRLLRLQSYREQRREDYALATKVATLRAHKEPEELAENDEYREMVARLDELREELDDTMASFGPSEFAVAFSEIGSEDVRVSGFD